MFKGELVYATDQGFFLKLISMNQTIRQINQWWTSYQP